MERTSVTSHCPFEFTLGRQCEKQFAQSQNKKVIKIMLPTAVIGKAVVPFLAIARLNIYKVKIIESEIREVLVDMNPFAKHQKSCHGDSLYSLLTVDVIASHLNQEVTVIEFFVGMSRIKDIE